MSELTFEDINLLDIGNTIQIAGTVWAGEGKVFVTPGPNSREDLSNISVMKLTLEQWEKLLRQADLMETEIFLQDATGITKTIYRKSQRQIDAVVQWKVFQRDNYACRYCGRTGIPLTVDHVDLWELGGITTPENLLSACKQCNKDRGRMEYGDWLNSPKYSQVSKNISTVQDNANRIIFDKLDELKLKRVKNIRSR